MDLGSPTPRRARGIVQDRSGEIEADSTARFASSVGNTVQQLGAQINAREDKFSYAQAKSSLLQADIATRKQLEDDPDWGTYEARYTEAMGKALEGSAKLIRTPQDRALFEMDAKLDTERGAGEVRNQAKRKEIDWGRSSTDQGLEANRAAAMNAPDDATREALLSTSKEMIIGAKEKGYYSEQEATNLFQGFRDSYALGYLDMQPPAKRIEMLTRKNTVADFLQPDVRAKLLEAAKKENRDLIVRRESQAQEDALVSKYGTGAAALAAARKIDDPEVRDSTVSRIKVRQAESDKAEAEYRESVQEESLAFINDGGKFADLPVKLKNGLKPTAANSLRNYAEQLAKPTPVMTDKPTYIDLSSKFADDPQAFGEVNLLDYRDKLDNTDFEKMVDLQRKVKSGNIDGKASGFQSITQIRDDRLREVFGNTKAKGSKQEKINSFVSQFEARLAAFKEDTGKQARATDAKSILDDMATEVAINWGSDKRAFELTDKDIDVPQQDRDMIISGLRKRGLAVTDENIKRAYAAANKKPQTDILKQADDIAAGYLQ
jgi:hypothetical protein